MDWTKLILELLEGIGELVEGHLAGDDEARHQAVLKLNRLTADAIAQKVL